MILSILVSWQQYPKNDWIWSISLSWSKNSLMLLQWLGYDDGFKDSDSKEFYLISTITHSVGLDVKCDIFKSYKNCFRWLICFSYLSRRLKYHWCRLHKIDWLVQIFRLLSFALQCMVAVDKPNGITFWNIIFYL